MVAMCKQMIVGSVVGVYVYECMSARPTAVPQPIIEKKTG